MLKFIKTELKSDSDLDLDFKKIEIKIDNELESVSDSEWKNLYLQF